MTEVETQAEEIRSRKLELIYALASGQDVTEAVGAAILGVAEDQVATVANEWQEADEEFKTAINVVGAGLKLRSAAMRAAEAIATIGEDPFFVGARNAGDGTKH